MLLADGSSEGRMAWAVKMRQVAACDERKHEKNEPMVRRQTVSQTVRPRSCGGCICRSMAELMTIL